MKGNVYAWVVILGLFFVTMMLWIIFSQVYAGHLWPWADEQFADMNMTEEQTTLDHLQNYWNYWPLLFVGVGLTVYGIAASLRRDPQETGYYG